MSEKMTLAQAQGVYRLLVEICKASMSEEQRFVLHFTGEMPTNEWRFQGALGFGGKFRYPRMTVDCYPEDETAERKEMIESANKALAALRVEAGLTSNTTEC